jgi:hypothetical protein
MKKLLFSRRDSFKEIITINGRKFKHFSLLNIPNDFGCQSTSSGKEGISEYINYKGLTYYAE